MRQPADDIEQVKRAVRRSVLERRAAMDASIALDRSRRIAGRVSGLDLLSSVRCVHAFWPIHEKREVDLRDLLRSWSSSGRTVVLPVVCRGDSPNHVRLEHRRFSTEDQLVVSPWGIAEPVTGDEVDPREIDLVIVPALSVDHEGTRIGYGMGFYDRFLRTIDAVRVCPIYDEDIVPQLPSEEHDETVDIIVSDRRTMTLRQRNLP